MSLKVVIPSSWENLGESSLVWVKNNRDMEKRANTIFGQEYDTLKPPKGHVGIHLVALGDYEHFGLNRNFDGFEKQSCEKYHRGFVDHGHLFENHKNTDPKLALGTVAASAYNEKMARVELFVHADENKAAKHLETYEKKGEISFSMACKVAYDTCTVCGAKRTGGRKDRNACMHLKQAFGQTEPDGTVVGTLNPEPYWFDISFVNRPADRIAFDLKKVASDETEFYAKWAEDLESGLTVPTSVLLDSDLAQQKKALFDAMCVEERKLRDVSGFSVPERLFYSTLKAAAVIDMPVALIQELRGLDTQDVFSSMIKSAVVMSPASFFAYTLGDTYPELSSHVTAAITKVASLDRTLDLAAEVCANTRYDAFMRGKSDRATQTKLASYGLTVDGLLAKPIFDEPKPLITLDKKASFGVVSTHESDVLAKEYLAYKLASLVALSESKPNTLALALSAAQNVTRSV